MDRYLVPVLRRQRFDGLDHVVDEGREREGLELQLHPTCLDLGEVENVVDQREQMTACAEHAVERFGVLLQRLRVLAQHLADADNGVERRAQLMAHIGEELRLMLARLGELPTLILNFFEQTCVLDRDHGLVCEGPDKLDLLIRKRPHCCPGQRDDANRLSLSQKRHPEHGAKRVKANKLSHGVFRIGLSIRNMDYLAFEHGTSCQRSPTDRNRMLLEVLFELGGVAGISHEMAGRAVAPEEQCVIRLAQTRRRLNEGVEHGLQIEGRAADHLQHVGGGGLLLQ